MNSRRLAPRFVTVVTLVTTMSCEHHDPVGRAKSHGGVACEGGLSVTRSTAPRLIGCGLAVPCSMGILPSPLAWCTEVLPYARPACRRRAGSRLFSCPAARSPYFYRAAGHVFAPFGGADVFIVPLGTAGYTIACRLKARLCSF